MAKALKEHWEPIWSRPDPSDDVIRDYLSDYTKKIGDIQEVSLEKVLEVLSRRRDSSTGPDGIPFSVYRSLADVVGPVFLRLV